MLKLFVVTIALAFLTLPVQADETKGRLQQHFNDVAQQVKKTSDPVEKREILESNLQKISGALETLNESQMISDQEREGIVRLQGSIRDMKDELEGTNGFARVTDDQLDDFAQYTVQNIEQAEQYVTISIITLLLIIILVVLLAK